MDMHCGVANSLALQLAGISTDNVHQINENTEGGVIEVISDSSGVEITGVVKENAMTLISSLIDADGSAEDSRSQFLTSAFEYLLGLGITSVHDMGKVTEELLFVHELL